MRSLLFTVFGVILAVTAGVSYLALSPAPERSSDSLTLVIETGSIPSPRANADAEGGNTPTSALGTGSSATQTTDQPSGNQPSLDEVIAARLRQAGQSSSATEASASNEDEAEPAAATGGSIAEGNGNADAGSVRTGGIGAAPPSTNTSFNAPAEASPPAGTVSITQMLAAKLGDGADAAAPAATDGAASQQAAGEEDGARNQPETRSSGQFSPNTAQSASSAKRAGRLGQSADPQVAANPNGEAAPLSAAQPASPGGSAPDLEIAALDPSIDQSSASQPQTQQPDAPPAAATPPDQTPEQTPDDAREAAAQPDTQPQSQRRLLSAADAPALPRQRGDFSLNGRIALVIRGLGVDAGLTERAIAQMPQQVAMGFVPYGDDLKIWTRRAQADRHDILIQIPLEPDNYPETNPGPHTLLTSLSIDENLAHLDWLLDRFNGVTGVTNYLGGKFASSPGAFAPMLMELKARDLLYLGDGKAANPASQELARQISLAFSVADTVIDRNKEPEAIQQSLAELEARARENGSVVAIGHAHGATLSALEGWIGTLNDKGLALVPVTEVVTPSAPRVSQSTDG